MKVYVVSKHWYQDSWVVLVTTDEAEADALALSLERWDGSNTDASVETFTLGEYQDSQA